MPAKVNNAQLPLVQKLHSVMGTLPPSRQQFATDLCNKFRQYGNLSTAQMEWVQKLTAMASQPFVPKEATANAPVHQQKIPGFTVVENLLYHAAQHTQFPCIRLRTEKGQKIELRPRKHSRQVKVKVDDCWGDVSGEILDTNSLRLLPDLTDVLNTLYQMAAHPVETAILYGKKYKSCCFCGISLTDPRSIVMGYGPICAGNYGLPWGEETLPEVTVNELEQLMEAQK